MNSDFWSGMATGMALIVAIGSQNAYVLRQGIRREHVLPLVLFCSVSDAVLILSGIGGAGVLIRSDDALLQITRYGGALFLFGYGLLAAKRAWQGSQMLWLHFFKPACVPGHRGAARLYCQPTPRPRSLDIWCGGVLGQLGVVLGVGVWCALLGPAVSDHYRLACTGYRDRAHHGCDGADVAPLKGIYALV
jgi:LysE type translocator